MNLLKNFMPYLLACVIFYVFFILFIFILFIVIIIVIIIIIIFPLQQLVANKGIGVFSAGTDRYTRLLT
jgi:hypothetical protein